MDYVLAIYRSRNVSMRAYNFLLQNGVTCALVSTPRGANVGCGLSVKMDKNALPSYRAVLSQGETFVGFFLIKQTYSGSTITKI